MEREDDGMAGQPLGMSLSQTHYYTASARRAE
jgi:hypothetical protein